MADTASLVDAVEPAALVAIGISPRWRHEGIGETRRALVRGTSAPVAIAFLRTASKSSPWPTSPQKPITSTPS